MYERRFCLVLYQQRSTQPKSCAGERPLYRRHAPKPAILESASPDRKEWKCGLSSLGDRKSATEWRQRVDCHPSRYSFAHVIAAAIAARAWGLFFQQVDPKMVETIWHTLSASCPASSSKLEIPSPSRRAMTVTPTPFMDSRASRSTVLKWLTVQLLCCELSVSQNAMQWGQKWTAMGRDRIAIEFLDPHRMLKSWRTHFTAYCAV